MMPPKHKPKNTLVLLGAGASYGSGECHRFTRPGEQCTPPLGTQLFEALASCGGEAASVPDHVMQAFAESFECGMTEYMAYSPESTMTFQRELAAYLADFVPGPGSDYVRLIRAMGHRTIFCSLNYDLMLEQAATQLGLKTTYSATPEPGYVRLLKPHGSSNFWPRISGVTFHGTKIGKITNAPIEILSREQTVLRCAELDSIAPAIAHYEPKKQVFVGEEFVMEQQTMWRDAAAGADNIYVCGVAVNEADEHIWGTLGRTQSAVTYFGSNNAKNRSSFDAWQATHNKSNADFRFERFSDAIDVMAELRKKSL